MGSRRKSREMAMQALYFSDMSTCDPARILDLYSGNFRPADDSRPFFERLVGGVLENGLEIDGVIERFSNNWKISRMSCVDRNILRIAVYEMLFCPDIPVKVAINEAIDIGKKYGTEESGAFINGILDGIRTALESQSIESHEQVKERNSR